MINIVKVGARDWPKKEKRAPDGANKVNILQVLLRARDTLCKIQDNDHSTVDLGRPSAVGNPGCFITRQW